MVRVFVQPAVYSSNESTDDLLEVLGGIFGSAPAGADATLMSAFVNLNGALPFVKELEGICAEGGSVTCYFGGSAHQRMSSRQAVEELLQVGATVHLLNRKKIFHPKLYGVSTEAEDHIVVTSGNLTGTGIELNIEGGVVMDPADCKTAGTSLKAIRAALESAFQWHKLTNADLGNPNNPAWALTFDENQKGVDITDQWVEDDDVLGITLSNTDVARITGTQPAGTQYFWLSKYLAGFFPPLTQLPEKVDAKRTFKTYVEVDFLDVGTKADCSVTFEAYNNLDFRLLTSPLKGTNLAKEGDIALLRRTGERSYRLRIVPANSPDFAALSLYLIHFVGHAGKRYGWIPVNKVSALT